MALTKAENSVIESLDASKLTGVLPASMGVGVDNVARTNIALNFFKDSVDHSRSVLNLSDGFVDQFEDQSGVSTSSTESYDASNDNFSGIAETAGYTIPKVNFNGSTTELRRNATGDYDSKVGIISMWIKWNGSIVDNSRIFSSSNGAIEFFMNGTGRFYLGLKNTAISNVFFAASLTQLVSGVDTHIVISWDLATSYYKMYINGVDDGSVATTMINQNVDFSRTEFTLGSAGNGYWFSPMDVGQFYFNISHSIDLTVPANLAKFITTSGGPVDMGATGSTPTSSWPRTYLNNPVATWNLDAGSAPDFTLNGTLASAGSLSSTPIPAENMSLLSESVTALDTPSTAQVTLFKEDVDVVTLNTDLVAWASRSKQTFTGTNATNILNVTNHLLIDTDRVVLTSSGTDLPLGLDSKTIYYVVTSTANTFQVSLTSGGSAVTFSDDGTGTHKVLALSLVTLTKESTVSPYDIVSGTVDVSSQPSGTDMSLVVQTKNLKDVKIHGQSLQWS